MERNENAQHTPGPWSVSPNDCFAIYAGDTCNQVAKATAWHDHREEAMANAILMAAAPELLAACVAALPLLEEYRQRVFTGRIRGDLLSGDYEPTQALRAAIAKARGES